MAELERLARSSPHLLADLGFTEDRRAANPQRRIWRRGTLCVTLSTSPGCVSAHVEVNDS